MGLKYLAMFPAGADRVVAQVLRRCGSSILHADDSSVMFTVTYGIGPDGLQFANNVFEILAVTRRASLEMSVERLLRALPKDAVPRSGTFRTMCHLDGRLTPMNAVSRRGLERALARRGAKFSPRGGGSEYWVIGRREWPDVVLGHRMDLGPRPKGAKGALSPQIAWLLASLSSPTASDIVLDPFAGSGAILQARAQWKYRELIYNDVHRNETGTKLQLRNLRRFRTDMLEKALPVQNVTAIITDPPWGEYDDVTMPYDEFTSAWWETTRSCRAAGGGSLVVLVNRIHEAPTTEALSQHDVLIDDTAPMLVNGHPATVVCGSWPARS